MGQQPSRTRPCGPDGPVKANEGFVVWLTGERSVPGVDRSVAGYEGLIKVAGRLWRHPDDPLFRALGERLEALRQRREQGLLVSIDFLKSLLDLARDLVETERTTPPATPEERGRAALTELFEEARHDRTPIMVERVVGDIDEIVRHVRFEGWQSTHAGEREVKKALRKTLFKYRLHQDRELFDRAYGYIRRYLLTPAAGAAA